MRPNNPLKPFLCVYLSLSSNSCVSPAMKERWLLPLFQNRRFQALPKKRASIDDDGAAAGAGAFAGDGEMAPPSLPEEIFLNNIF